MATTSNTHIVGGSGQAGPYSYSFPILADADIRVSVNGVVKSVTTHYTLDSSNTRITFVSGQEPSTGDKVIVYRDTDEDPINSTFVSGSTIRSNELNDNFSQLLYIAQESDNQSLSKLGGVMEGDVGLGLKTKLYFEGDTDNAYETTLTVVDPTADRTITLPNVTGTVVTTGDTGTVTTQMIEDATIVAADLASNSVTTAKVTDGAITNAKIAQHTIERDRIQNNAIGNAALDNNSVKTSNIENLNITTAKLADDAVTADKLASNSVGQYTIIDGSVTTGKLPNNAVTGDKIASNAVATAKIADDAVTTAKIAAGNITATEIADNAVTHGKMDNNSVGTAELRAGEVTLAKLAADSVDASKIAANSIGSSEIAANAVGSSEIANNAVTGDHIADDAINSEHYVAGSIDTEHIGDNQVTTAKIPDNAVTTAKIADAELTTLAGMQSGTASVLASSTALTSTTAELNLLDGKSIVTTIGGNATDVQLPTAQAVNERVVELVTEVGGFVPIANETSFPSTNPDINDGAGTIVSIKALSSAIVCGSGVTTKTIPNGAGSGNTVTINGLAQNTTYPAGRGMLVETTSTLHTYTYHRLTLDESGVADAQTAVDDFNARYRVASSAPSSSLDDGDLYFDTTANKMKVYNASSSSWDDVAAPGNFFINTISSSSGSGGGSATFNGTATRFTLSNPPSQGAQQCIVSVNGVVQKPNSGSSVPSEGFAIDGNDILFSTAPASGSDYFIVTCGNSVNIGTPSNNTVSTDKIQNLAVTDAKIANDTISEGKLDIHNAPSGTDKYLKYTANGMEWVTVPAGVGGALGVDFTDNTKARWGTGNDLEIFHDGSNSYVKDAGTGELRIEADAGGVRIQRANGHTGIYYNVGGQVDLYYDNSKKLETANTGVKWHGDLFCNDNNYIKLGDSGDLKIWHDGSNSRIHDVGTGVLVLAGNNINLNNAASTEYCLTTVEDGAVSLYYDGGKKFETRSDGVKLTQGHFYADNSSEIKLGDSADIRIYHDSANNYWNASNGHTYILANTNNIYLRGVNNEDGIIVHANSGVDLFFNNSKKLETTNSGVSVTGDITINSNQTYYGFDNAKVSLGHGNDLQFYHDGTHSYLRNNTNQFYCLAQNNFYVQHHNDGSSIEDMIIARGDASVELYYDNTKKFETRSTGVHIEAHNDIRLANGNWTGDTYGKIQHHSNILYMCGGSNGFVWKNNTTEQWIMEQNGTFRPITNNTYDLGGSSHRIRNLYTADLQMSNEGSANEVDGTWGNYTIQEGENDLFLINRRNGKKYKFNLTEVS